MRLFFPPGILTRNKRGELRSPSGCKAPSCTMRPAGTKPPRRQQGGNEAAERPRGGRGDGGGAGPGPSRRGRAAGPGRARARRGPPGWAGGGPGRAVPRLRRAGAEPGPAGCGRGAGAPPPRRSAPGAPRRSGRGAVMGLGGEPGAASSLLGSGSPSSAQGS